MDFDSEEKARLWIIRNQLSRRNLPDFVKCELVLPFEAELKAEAKKRQIRKAKNFVPPNLAGQKRVMRAPSQFFYIRLTSIADYNRISTESENGDNLPRTNETGTA